MLHAGLSVPTTRRPRQRQAGWHVAAPEDQEGRRGCRKKVRGLDPGLASAQPESGPDHGCRRCPLCSTSVLVARPVRVGTEPGKPWRRSACPSMSSSRVSMNGRSPLELVAVRCRQSQGAPRIDGSTGWGISVSRSGEFQMSVITGALDTWPCSSARASCSKRHAAVMSSRW